MSSKDQNMHDEQAFEQNESQKFKLSKNSVQQADELQADEQALAARIAELEQQLEASQKLNVKRCCTRRN